MLRVRAGRVLPVTAPPIEDGAVLVDSGGGGGRITAIGPDARVPTPRGTRSLVFPHAVLVPGLVNCHTHLELTHLGGQNAEPDFVRWIRRVRELKDASPDAAFLASADAGIRDCWARGVTCVADTGSTGAVLEALARMGGRGVCYQEVFGPDPAQIERSLAELATALDRLRPSTSERVRLGVSPHAPYTVSEPLYRAVAALAREGHLPLAVHLAESLEETLLVRDGAGGFAAALRARGITVTPAGVSPVGYLARLGVLTAGDCLCIHCVQADADDIALLAKADAAVAYCPRSNAAHGHGRAPLGVFLAAGLRVGVGTDSVVSVADLDLWADAGEAGLKPADALRLLTIGGARALGWDREIGSLEVGKQADLAVLPALPDARVHQPRAPALLTVVAGRIVHERVL